MLFIKAVHSLSPSSRSRLHSLLWSRFSLVKPDLETTDQGPLRSDQTEIFRSLYAIRPNGIRLDITPTLVFFSAFIIASGTTVVTRKAHALRVTEFSKKAIAQQRKKAASHKRSYLKSHFLRER